MDSIVNNSFLSPVEAAELAKVSRPTISRALKSGDLHGIRDNSGKWKITHEALHEWASRRTPVQFEQRSNSVHEQLAHAREKLSAAEAKAVLLTSQVEDLRTERDRLLTILETRPPIVVRRRTRLFKLIFGD